jgi:DNA-binding ferritin-like protein
MNFVSTLLTITNQLHIYHWQTTSGFHHDKFGEAYDNLDGLLDRFVEVFMGKNGRITSKEGFDLQLSNITEINPVDFINKMIDFLTNDLPKALKEEDTDLLNIRDEMLAELNKLKYLITSLK